MKYPAATYELVADKVGRVVDAKATGYRLGNYTIPGTRVWVQRPDGRTDSLPLSKFNAEVRVAFPKDRNLENPSATPGAVVYTSLPCRSGPTYPWFARVERATREKLVLQPFPFVDVKTGENVMKTDIVEVDGGWCNVVDVRPEQVPAICRWLQTAAGACTEQLARLVSETGKTERQLEELVGLPY